MSLISQYMPEFSLRQVRRIAVKADPELAYLRVRALDLNDARMVRRFTRLRSLPARLRRWWQGYRRARPKGARIDDLVGTVAGVTLLGERPSEEVVVGLIGKLWRPTRALERVAHGEFRTFGEPGFAKLAVALRVAPRAFGGSWITIELRAKGTSAAADTSLRRAWCVLGRLSAAISARLFERLGNDLGPLVEDEGLHLPGDALLQDALFQLTHAVTLEAPRPQVWSWLLDLGMDHAALAPSAQTSASSDAPPGLALGVPLPGLRDPSGECVVVRAEPPRLLVLGNPSLLPQAEGTPRRSFSAWSTTWAFVLTPIGDDATRLIIRVRSRWEFRQGMALLEPLLATVYDALERRQLDSLRRQAESFESSWAA